MGQAAHAIISAPRPPTTERVVALNRGQFVGEPSAIGPLERFDGQVLDVRSPRDFAAGHLAGAINVPVSGSSVGTKAGFLLDLDAPVAIHASSPREAEEAARRLRAVGLLDLAGYLVDVEATERLEPIALDELERLLADNAVEVVDVREKDERDEGYIPGSRNIPYRLLPIRDDLRVLTRYQERQARRDRLTRVVRSAGQRAAGLVHRR